MRFRFFQSDVEPEITTFGLLRFQPMVKLLDLWLIDIVGSLFWADSPNAGEKNGMGAYIYIHNKIRSILYIHTYIIY